MNSRKFKIIGDIVTIALLTAAFSMAFYFGFFADESGTVRLSGEYLSLITIGGMGVLFFVGEISAYSSRQRLGALTPFFVGGFCAQIAAFVGLLAICFSIMFDIFANSVESWLLRVLYIFFALVVIAGYAEAVFISEPLIARLAPADEDEDEYEEEDEDYEDEEE